MAKSKRPRHRSDRTNRAREIFLDELRKTCNVSAAAWAAGIRRGLAYEWKETDSAFAAAWAEAEQMAADALEREAWRRGVDGVDKPVVYKGEITDTYREYSDRMLELLLKAHRPEKFRERISAEVTGKDGGPVAHRYELTDEQLAAIAAGGGDRTAAKKAGEG